MNKIRIVAFLGGLTCSAEDFKIWKNQHIENAKNAGATSIYEHIYTESENNSYYFVYDAPANKLSDLRELLKTDLKKPSGMPNAPLAMFPNRWIGTLVGDKACYGLDTSTPAEVTLLFMDKLQKIF